jgi:uncharacterized glyoxalase superfamily protein PhnB
MSVWVDDVDEMHKHCVAAGLEITFPPTDMPWHVREMHLRHPDGHVFRVGRGFEAQKVETQDWECLGWLEALNHNECYGDVSTVNA